MSKLPQPLSINSCLSNVHRAFHSLKIPTVASSLMLSCIVDTLSDLSYKLFSLEQALWELLRIDSARLHDGIRLHRRRGGGGSMKKCMICGNGGWSMNMTKEERCGNWFHARCAEIRVLNGGKCICGRRMKGNGRGKTEVRWWLELDALHWIRGAREMVKETKKECMEKVGNEGVRKLGIMLDDLMGYWYGKVVEQVGMVKRELDMMEEEEKRAREMKVDKVLLKLSLFGRALRD